MLKNLRLDTEWTQFTPEDYCITTKDDQPFGLLYKCPGCGSLVGITVSDEHPRWNINFETLTATPSILHTRATPQETSHGIKGGCGWHGYLTNGELIGKIE